MTRWRTHAAALLAAVADRLAPDPEARETRTAAVRLGLAMWLLDASDRMRGLPSWRDVARVYGEPAPSTLRSVEPATNAQGGEA